MMFILSINDLNIHIYTNVSRVEFISYVILFITNYLSPFLIRSNGYGVRKKESNMELIKENKREFANTYTILIKIHI